MPHLNSEYALRMLEKPTEVNVVRARIETENLRNSRGRWTDLRSQDTSLFPRLTIDKLHDLTFRTYQVYLFPWYIQDRC